MTFGVGLQGLAGNLVTVEVDIADGLPSYTLLGLPDAALSESRDRVRSALTNSNELWPNRKVTVSLSPAWLPKSGPSFDLAIAVALLIANQTLPNCEDTVFLGELSLDGKVRSVRGALPALLAAAKAGITRAVVPAANLAEAKLMVDLEIIPMSTLAEVLRWLRTGERAEAEPLDLQYESDEGLLDFADVAGATACAVSCRDCRNRWTSLTFNWTTRCRKNHDRATLTHDLAQIINCASSRSYRRAFNCWHFRKSSTAITVGAIRCTASHHNSCSNGRWWRTCN